MSEAFTRQDVVFVSEGSATTLAHRLQELGLINDADWRRCSAVVCRMSRDLPRYDSVYVDALKQLKKITPFQAQRLFDQQAESLRVRQWILVDQLEEQIGFSRYLVKTAEQQKSHSAELWCYELPQSCPLEPRQLTRRVQAIQQKLNAINAATSNSPRHVLAMALASDVYCEQETLVLVQQVSSGWPMRDLLIRRGRIPADLTSSLLVQSLMALEQLHQQQLIHGDIRPETIWLTPKGTLRLTSIGIRPLLIPQPALYDLADRSVSRYWSASLMQPGGEWTRTCDLYALGLTLWELAAGRPAYLHANPYEHLAARQRDPVPPISDYAPDLPSHTAQIIDELCALDAQVPGPQPADLLSRLKSVANGPAKVQAYLNMLPMPQQEQIKRHWSVVPMVIATLIMLAVSLPILATSMLSPENRQVAENTKSAVDVVRKQRAEILAAMKDTPAELMNWLDQASPLPEPDLLGSVTLESGVCYKARQLETSGVMKVAAAGTSPAVIVIDEQWELNAAVLALENLLLIDRRAMKSSEPLFSAAITISCRELDCNRLTDLSLVPGSKSLEQASTSVLEWSAGDAAALNARRLRFQDCLLTTHGGVMCIDQPGKLEFDNVLTLASVPLIQLLTPPALGEQTVVSLQNVCSRGSAPILESLTASVLADRGWLPWQGEIRIEATDSLFAPVVIQGQQAASLISLVGDSADKQLLASSELLSLIGRNVLISHEARLLSIQAGGVDQTPSTDQLGIEGVIKSKLTFAGSSWMKVDSSVLVDFVGPRFAAQLPGIEPNRLTFGDSSVTVLSSSR